MTENNAIRMNQGEPEDLISGNWKCVGTVNTDCGLLCLTAPAWYRELDLAISEVMAAEVLPGALGGNRDAACRFGSSPQDGILIANGITMDFPVYVQMNDEGRLAEVRMVFWNADGTRPETPDV